VAERLEAVEELISMVLVLQMGRWEVRRIETLLNPFQQERKIFSQFIYAFILWRVTPL
jgi:hypothetical protein